MLLNLERHFLVLSTFLFSNQRFFLHYVASQVANNCNKHRGQRTLHAVELIEDGNNSPGANPIKHFFVLNKTNIVHNSNLVFLSKNGS